MNREMKFAVLATTSILVATLSSVGVASAGSKTKPKLHKQVKIIAATKRKTSKSNYVTHKTITKSRVLRPEGEGHEGSDY